MGFLIAYLHKYAAYLFIWKVSSQIHVHFNSPIQKQVHFNLPSQNTIVKHLQKVFE